MKRLILASALAASTLWFSAPASASIPPPLPRASSSFTAGSLHVDEYGTAGKPAMIFIPGLTCGPWEWAGEIERYSPDYAIYALTLPGFDGQPAVAGPLFQTVTADFWALLQTRHIDKPIVIGHSLGGTLAIMLAEQHSDRLRAVIAVDGMPIFPGMEKMAAAQRDAAARQFDAMLSSAKTPQQFEYAEKTYALPALISSAADIDAIAPLVAKSDPKASGAWAAEDVGLDLRPQLNRIAVPLLEVVPGSGLAPYYQTLLAGDARAQIAPVENSRHFVMYDQPQALHAVIARFVSGIRG